MQTAIGPRPMANIEDVKRWAAKRKSALLIEIIQGKTTVAEANHTYDLTPSEVENWADDARKGMENALKANPLDALRYHDPALLETLHSAVRLMSSAFSQQILEHDIIQHLIGKKALERHVLALRRP